MFDLRGPHLALAAIISITGAACHHASGRAPSETPGSPVADSVQGTVRLVGTSAFPQVTVSKDDGGPSIALVGPTSLRAVVGLRVVAVGFLVGAKLQVSQFTVLAANGIVATDGILTAEGQSLVLITREGTKYRLVDPSPVLRNAVKHRVWVSGPLDRAPVAYGIIE